MDILHVTPYFAPAWAYGGPPRSVYELCRELVRRGHNITVLTTDAYDARSRVGPATENLEGVQVHRMPNLSNQLAWRRQLFLPHGTNSFLRNRLPEFEIVHLHMYRTAQDVIVHRHTSRHGIPYVFSARGSLPRIVRGLAAKAVFDLAIGTRVLQRASRCIASSETERAQYEAMGVSPQRVRTIHNGLDSSVYRDLPSEGALARRYAIDDKRIVTYVGRLNARKGLDYLLHAFRELAERDANTHLLFAGPDEGYRRPLERLARSLDLTNRVTFTGLLTGRDRLSAFVDSEVVVYPAKNEIFGLVPFEALACGKPVVVADDSGCGEIIRRAQAGLVVPVEDTSTLAMAIIQSLEGGPEIRRMVEAGKRFVLEELSWDTIGDQMEEAYREALATFGTAPSIVS